MWKAFLPSSFPKGHDGSNKGPEITIETVKNRSLNENPITAAIFSRWFQMQITRNHVSCRPGPFRMTRPILFEFKMYTKMLGCIQVPKKKKKKKKARERSVILFLRDQSIGQMQKNRDKNISTHSVPTNSTQR